MVIPLQAKMADILQGYDVNFLFENKPLISAIMSRLKHSTRCLYRKGLRVILKLSTEKPPYRMTFHYHLKDDSIDLKDIAFIKNEEQF